jgi:hypothetical protein
MREKSCPFGSRWTYTIVAGGFPAEEELIMAKAKKEFKSRVRKMQKHVRVLIDLAPHEEQRETLYALQGSLDRIEKDQEAYFDDPAQGSEPPRRDSAPATA